MSYIEVAVPLPINGTFTYRVPGTMGNAVEVGKRVLVPFKDRKLIGYVLEEAASVELQEVKEVLEVLDPDPLFHPGMVSFFKWISQYYLCPIGQVIHSALPSGIDPTRIRSARITRKGLQALESLDNDSPARPILQWIRDNPEKAVKYPYSRLKPLVEKDWIRLQDRVRKGRAVLLTRTFVKLKEGINSLEQLHGLLKDSRAKNESEFLEMVLKKGAVLRSELAGLFSNASYLIQKWVNRGVLELLEGQLLRNPLGDLEIPRPVPDKLFAQQRAALREIEARLEEGGGFWPALLYGVTGSGKTEVYFRAIETAVSMGKGAIFMAPEISLASYLAGLFKARFGGEIALYHSGLNEGERYEQWVRMARGEIRVVFGARSAVFAPLPQIGLIVVDEEHDPSYKQDVSPRYHGRDAAVMRARLEQALVLLGSGTPSVQSFHNAREGRYARLDMPYRIEQRPFPRVEVVDMREVVSLSKGAILSPHLKDAISQTLDRGDQCILFLNRRGFHRMVLCCSCGEALRCPNCDVALTHHHDDELRCHYCGFEIPSVEQCPGCQGHVLKAFGFGTQRLEEEVKRLFPTATVQRMDTDTTRRKGIGYSTIRSFADRDIDILLGTQMITKGYDFPGVTLVGVVAADLSLCFPDFRAAERTYQLLSQVAGRAGRGEKRGVVIIQTFNPKHYAIEAAVGHDYEGFYEKERALREQLGYPPFTHLTCVRLQGNLKERTEEAAHDLAGRLRKTLDSWPAKGSEIKVLGPAQAPIPKLRGKYRWQILLKAARPSLAQYLLREVERIAKPGLRYKGVAVIFDVDPYQMT